MIGVLKRRLEISSSPAAHWQAVYISRTEFLYDKRKFWISEHTIVYDCSYIPNAPVLVMHVQKQFFSKLDGRTPLCRQIWACLEVENGLSQFLDVRRNPVKLYERQTPQMLTHMFFCLVP